MKKRFAILTTALAAALGLLLFAACANPFINPMRRNDGPAASEGKGLVRIGTGAGAARTALPAAVFDHIEYLFSHNGGVSQTLTPAGDGGDEFELESGNWTVTVNAYAGPGNDTLAASGTEAFTIILGEETGVTVKLSPVVSEGTGTLSYALIYPEGAAVKSFTLTLLADENDVDLAAGASSVGGSLTGTKTVNAGYYLAHAVLQKDGITAGKTEIAHIYRNMATNLSFVFYDDDFRATLVFSGADSGPGSLREAIANALPDGTIALILPENDRVITLQSTLSINKNLTILGNGATITQSGFNGSLVSIANKTVTISRVHFTGGRTTGNGGAISTSGSAGSGTSLVLESCIFSNNQATGDGGAIYIYGNRYILITRGSTFYGNRAGSNGGAIYGPILELTGDIFYGNTAAGSISAIYLSTPYVPSAYSSSKYSVSDTNYWSSDRFLLSFTTGNKVISNLIISPLSFRPLGGLGASGAEGIASRPAEYPVVDFLGTVIPDTNIAAGAIQTPTASGLYFLDYAALGPGLVSVSSGVLDEDGLTSGPVSLSAEETDGGGFRYWLADGTKKPEPSATLTLTVSAHATVRAVFYAEVSVAADNVPGSLRDAIAKAPGSGVIIPAEISPILYGDLAITESVVIEGKGAIINLSGHHIVISGAATEVAISRVHFTGGAEAGVSTQYGGGAIQNGGILAIESCIFSNNQVPGAYARGGAIYTAGTLAVSGSTFYGNSAGAGQGGAIWIQSGTVALRGNLFWGNTAASYSVVRGSPTSQGFNISDKPKGTGATESGFSHANDKQAASLPFSSVSFRPFATGDAAQVIIERPSGYPTADFYGEDIPDDNAAAGAAQETIAPSGYILDYAVQGPGTVEFTGTRDEDGFVSSDVALTAHGKNDTVVGTFKHWIVNDDGGTRQESDNPLTLTLSADTTVLAVFGGVWTVQSGANGGPGSFREALGLLADGDVVILDGQTITLSEPMAATAKKFAIQGNGATLTQSGFSSGNADALLSFSAGAEVNISRVWFKGGRTTGQGGAISSARATLALESCIFSSNQAGSGGAIYTTYGTLTLLGCTFYGNSATGAYGAAIHGSGVNTVTLTGNIFWGNTPISSVVYPSSVTASFTVSDGEISGSTVPGSQPISPVSLKPLAGAGADGIIISTPLDYPALDFDGEVIPGMNAAAGAIQTLFGGYSLDYTAQGPGTIEITVGAADDEGYAPGTTVTLTAIPENEKEFLHWIVNGIKDPETSTTLSLTMNGHKTVRGVFAATWTVISEDSLQEALASQNDGDRIILSGSATIILSSSLPQITKSITVEGNGATLTQSDFTEGDTTQLLYISGATAEVSISRLHFKGGRAANYGAAIYNAGKLTLESCVFSDNRTSNAGAYGGAVYTTGGTASVIVSGCTFYGNAAGANGGKGGAIYRDGGALALTGNVFWGNTAATSPEVYHTSGATTGGYNVSDRESGYAGNAVSSGWTFGGGDTTAAFRPVGSASFKPIAGGVAEGIIATRPESYPAVDFYGAAIPASTAAAGAAQTTVSGFVLDYAAQGPGQVDLVSGSPDEDDLFATSSNISLIAEPDLEQNFLKWTVNGVDDQEASVMLSLTMDGNKTVRAIFGGDPGTITSAGDSGPGSLREALTNAEDGDSIILYGQTIILATPLLITKSITIEGNGATLTQTSFTESGTYQLVYINSAVAEVSISRLHFMGGRASTNGAAIYNNGATLTLESCVFSDNRTSGASAQGGAVYTSGGTASVSVSGCTFYGNAAGTTSGKGGAIYRDAGTLTLTGNLFWGNTANTSPVVYYSDGATTGGYNVSDKGSGYADNAASSGWTFAGGDTQLGSLPIFPVNFKPFAGIGADSIIATRPGIYPLVDFYGVGIQDSNAAAGAVQTTATGYILDYVADGANAVNLTEGNMDDGLYTGDVTLEVPIANRPAFLYWTVNGETQSAQTPSYQLILAMNGHKTVRAVFADIAVTSAGDSGDGTLRAVLASAAAGNVIALPAGATIILASELQVTKSVTIMGNGATLTQNGITPKYTSQLLRITSSGAVVRISRLHFKGGRALDNGAAINSLGTLALESCVFSDNQTSSSMAYGGAIYAEGNTTIFGCTFYGNVAGTNGNGSGGAISSFGNSLTLAGNIFWGNTGYDPVVYSIFGTTTKGYNVSDKQSGEGQSGWTFTTGDTRLTDVIFDGDYKPSSVTGLPAIPSLIEGFPTTYFDGNIRETTGSTPGAMPGN